MSIKDTLKNAIGGGSGKEQPPASPEPQAPKAPYVLNEASKEHVRAQVRREFEADPTLEYPLRSVDQLVAQGMTPEDAVRDFALQEESVAYLAELKAEAAAKEEQEKDPEVEGLVANGKSRLQAERMVREKRAEADRVARKKSGEKHSFKVLSRLGYDGKDLEPGDVVEMTQAEADEIPWAVNLIEEEKES